MNKGGGSGSGRRCPPLSKVDTTTAAATATAPEDDDNKSAWHGIEGVGHGHDCDPPWAADDHVLVAAGGQGAHAKVGEGAGTPKVERHWRLAWARQRQGEGGGAGRPYTLILVALTYPDSRDASKGAMSRGRQARAPWAMTTTKGR